VPVVYRLAADTSIAAKDVLEVAGDWATTV